MPSIREAGTARREPADPGLPAGAATSPVVRLELALPSPLRPDAALARRVALEVEDGGDDSDGAIARYLRLGLRTHHRHRYHLLAHADVAAGPLDRQGPSGAEEPGTDPAPAGVQSSWREARS